MAVSQFSGTGDPNGVVFGDPGDLYQDETGSIWLKETGLGTNTGWVERSGPSGSDVLTFRPGSGLTGPVVFDDFNALYAKFDALRTAAQGSGKFQIVFDDQDIGGPGNTVVLDSGSGGVTYDFQYATLVGVHEDANVLLDIKAGGGEGDGLTIVNALWFEGLTIRVTGSNTAGFFAANDQTFTLTRTTFLGGGGQFVMNFLAVTNCILHLNDESTIERDGVFPAGNGAVRINNSLVLVHMNGANCRVNANAFVSGGGAQLTPIINSSSARFDFDQADAGGVVNAQMSTAAGYWTYGAPFTVTDPNGVLTATKSTLIVDEATNLIWRNTDGATAWEQVATSVPLAAGATYTEDFVSVENVATSTAGGAVVVNNDAPLPTMVGLVRLSGGVGGSACVFPNADPANVGFAAPIFNFDAGSFTCEWRVRWLGPVPAGGADAQAFIGVHDLPILGGSGGVPSDGALFQAGFALNGNANWWVRVLGNGDQAVDTGVPINGNPIRLKAVATFGVDTKFFVNDVLVGTILNGVANCDGFDLTVAADGQGVSTLVNIALDYFTLDRRVAR